MHLVTYGKPQADEYVQGGSE